MRDKMMNHGGSPPNLGLKEATPALGETRLNRGAFNNITATRTNQTTTLCNTFTTPTKVCTMIHKWNHKHWVKVGFQLGYFPYHTISITTSFMPFWGFQKSINSMPFRGFHKTKIFMPFRGCSQTFSKHNTINYRILEKPYFINFLSTPSFSLSPQINL